MKRPHRSGRSQSPRWSGLSDGELLQLRFCDLNLRLADCPVHADIDDLYETLARRNIRFRPHVWLSTEWFSPDGIPGIAIPFFAAHPRLAQLERRMKGEAEGGNRVWRRRILRHEAGHALDTAFGLRRRADWRAVFGRASKPYPKHYSVRPASRRYVQHLGHWYAQSHPVEDFAETFAVWLQPRARWRREYDGWPALRKLEYVDELMTSLGGRRPDRRDRSIVSPLHENRRTLREHYRRSTSPDDLTEKRYDAWLKRAFRNRETRPDAMPAAQFLAGIAPSLRQQLARGTGAGPYLAGHVMEALRRRARELDLVLPAGKREARARALRLHERVIMDLLSRNRERYLL